MHTHSIDQWQHDHVYLGAQHAQRERRIWLVVALTAVMMVVEIVAGWMFHSMALFADLSEGKSDIERGGVMPERLPWSIEAAVLGSAGVDAAVDDGAVWPVGAVDVSAGAGTAGATEGFARAEGSFSPVMC